MRYLFLSFFLVALFVSTTCVKPGVSWARVSDYLKSAGGVIKSAYNGVIRAKNLVKSNKSTIKQAVNDQRAATAQDLATISKVAGGVSVASGAASQAIAPSK